MTIPQMQTCLKGSSNLLQPLSLNWSVRRFTMPSHISYATQPSFTKLNLVSSPHCLWAPLPPCLLQGTDGKETLITVGAIFCTFTVHKRSQGLGNHNACDLSTHIIWTCSAFHRENIVASEFSHCHLDTWMTIMSSFISASFTWR